MLTGPGHRSFQTQTRMTQRDKHNPLLLAILFAPIFMVVLDVFIVNVAAPSLRADLGATESEVQWVVAAYLLTYAVSLITGGRLGDVVGRRRMFRLGLAGFTLASALCAAAPSPAFLIGARLLQGLGGAAMWPQVLSIIQVEFETAERPRAFGVQGMVQGLAAIAGQIVGGGLIALDLFGLGWRWVFLVNIPFGLIAWIAAARVVPESRSETARRLDLGGVALCTLALVLVMVPVIEGRDLGWPAWGFGAMVVAVAVAAAFARFERRLTARGEAPLIAPALFRERGFRLGVLAAVSLYFVIAFFLLLSIYMQSGLGLGPFDSALAFTPLAVAFVAGSITGPRLSERLRAHLPQAGAAIAALALIGTIGVVESSGGSISSQLILVIVPFGAGMGLAVPALINLVLQAVPRNEAGSAAGVLTTSQQMGNALGVAIIGTIFFAVLGDRSGPAAYGDAFSIAIGVQAGLALAAAGLLTRVRERAPAAAPAFSGAGGR
jgi:EmrB/QacA subfamily drug resistance transporter